MLLRMIIETLSPCGFEHEDRDSYEFLSMMIEILVGSFDFEHDDQNPYGLIWI